MACGLPALVDTETARAFPEAELFLLEENVIGENAAKRWLSRLNEFTQDKSTFSGLRPSIATFARNHWSWKKCVDTYKSLAEIHCLKTNVDVLDTSHVKTLDTLGSQFRQVIATHCRHSYKDTLTTCGIFLLSLTLYILLSPGRIDMVDGQWRFEVAYNLIHSGTVAITDPALFSWGLPGINEHRYSTYGLSGSVIATPLLYFAEFLSIKNRDLAQFFFAMTSPLIGALTLSTLYKIYRNFGVTSLSSLFWVWVLGFATLFLPLSTSVFDQVQNAYFVLVSFYAAYEANRRNSLWSAAVGGAAFVILINFKEVYVILWPGLLWSAGLNWLRRDVIRQIRNSKVIQILMLSGLIGIAGLLTFNLIRFAHPFPPASLNHPPLLGNFFIGLAGLTMSTGKGLLWYSPAVLLVVYGWRTFWKTVPVLAQGILIAFGTWTVLIASLTFFGGDWCWGPRYWVPVFPLVFLAMPFSQWRSNGRKTLAALIIILSFCIQLLAISMDHQRFFFERGLESFFWYKDNKFYFNNSALLARFSELSELQSPSQRKIVSVFRPGPYPELLTYTVFGPSPNQLKQSQEWLLEYPVFSLPRPWPIWTLAVQDEHIISARNKAIRLILFASIGGLSAIFCGITCKKVP
jgi:hypothetical protein